MASFSLKLSYKTYVLNFIYFQNKIVHLFFLQNVALKFRSIKLIINFAWLEETVRKWTRKKLSDRVCSSILQTQLTLMLDKTKQNTHTKYTKLLTIFSISILYKSLINCFWYLRWSIEPLDINHQIIPLTLKIILKSLFL